MIRKILVPLFCLTIIISANGMQPEQSVRFSKDIIEQQRYKEWEKVKQTPEFMDCAELTMLQRRPSDPDLINAFKRLHETEEFKKYISIDISSENPCLLTSLSLSGEKT